MVRQEAKKEHFVADGCDRARIVLEPLVRAEVEAEYTEILQTASFWQRLLLRKKVNREIERRIREAAPPDALY